MASTGRTILKIVGGLVVAVILLVAIVFIWAGSATTTRLAKTYETHRIELPVPFPLDDAELAALRTERAAAAPPAEPKAAPPEGTLEAAPDPLAGVDLAAIAMERAVSRGQHLVSSRYACFECHGQDLAGGTMVNDPAIGQLFGPNLTGGAGSRAGTFTISDWDRSIRHGVRPDGTPAVMPSADFFAMSDHELSDVVAFIKSRPKVDKTMAPLTFGPLGKILVAAGKINISAELLKDHVAPHLREPPVESDPIAFGKHLAQTCTGCHNAELTGGPIAGGPPDWAPAANLTPHAEGLAGWTLAEFKATLRDGKKRDGTPLKAPMSMVPTITKNMKESELDAIFAYLQSVPARPSRK